MSVEETRSPSRESKDAEPEEAAGGTANTTASAPVRDEPARGSRATPLTVSTACHQHPDGRRGLGCSRPLRIPQPSTVPSEPCALRSHQGGRGSQCSSHHPVHTCHHSPQTARGITPLACVSSASSRPSPSASLQGGAQRRILT